MSDTSLQAQIGYRVRRRRMALGWNQTELADQMHMPQGHISRLELGKYAAVNPEKLVALAQVLRTTTDYLMGLSDDPGAIEPVQGGGEDTKQNARADTPAPSRHRLASEGAPREPSGSPLHAQIMGLLAAHPAGCTRGEIEAALDMNRPLEHVLRGLWRRGRLARVGPERYALPGHHETGHPAKEMSYGQAASQ